MCVEVEVLWSHMAEGMWAPGMASHASYGFTDDSLFLKLSITEEEWLAVVIVQLLEYTDGWKAESKNALMLGAAFYLTQENIFFLHQQLQQVWLWTLSYLCGDLWMQPFVHSVCQCSYISFVCLCYDSAVETGGEKMWPF